MTKAKPTKIRPEAVRRLQDDPSDNSALESDFVLGIILAEALLAWAHGGCSEAEALAEAVGEEITYTAGRRLLAEALWPRFAALVRELNLQCDQCDHDDEEADGLAE